MLCPSCKEILQKAINNENLSFYLIKPINPEWIILIKTLPSRIALSMLPISIGILLVVLNISLFQPTSYIVQFMISSLLAGAMSYFMFMLVGMLSFWMIRVHGITATFGRLLEVLTGFLFPLDILPTPIFNLLAILPFQYLGFVPVSIYLGRFNPDQINRIIFNQLIWVVVLYLISHIVWKKGLMKYDSAGN